MRRLVAARAQPRLTLADAQAVAPAVVAKREAFYQDRYNEQFEGNKPLRVAAAAVAEIYQDNSGPGLFRDQLERALAAALTEGPFAAAMTEAVLAAAPTEGAPRPPARFNAAQAAAAHIDALIRWDYLWQPHGSRCLRPGIPSFMAYTLQNCREGLPPPPRTA